MSQLGYAIWIKATVKDNGRGQCREVTEAMAAAFPELKRVRGHYLCWEWGPREHWWLVDPDGIVVDPTWMQFPSKGDGIYQPWDETQPEPTGMCPNCGGYCYNGDYCCSDNCGRAYAAFCMGPC